MEYQFLIPCLTQLFKIIGLDNSYPDHYPIPSEGYFSIIYTSMGLKSTNISRLLFKLIPPSPNCQSQMAPSLSQRMLADEVYYVKECSIRVELERNVKFDQMAGGWEYCPMFCLILSYVWHYNVRLSNAIISYVSNEPLMISQR